MGNLLTLLTVDSACVMLITSNKLYYIPCNSEIPLSTMVELVVLWLNDVCMHWLCDFTMCCVLLTISFKTMMYVISTEVKAKKAIPYYEVTIYTYLDDIYISYILLYYSVLAFN